MDYVPPSYPSEQTVEVVTYNIRYDNPEDVARGNGWAERRREHFFSWLGEKSADIYGFQEVLPSQFAELKEALPEYDAYGVPRDDGATRGELSPIFWRRDRFELGQAVTRWLSETPSEPSRGWDAGLPRIATQVMLLERASGRPLVVWNTHFDNLGSQARLESARLIAKFAEIAGFGVTVQPPMVLLGDLNAVEQSPPVAALLEAGWRLVDASAGAEIRGPHGTIEPKFEFHQSPHRIDHVLWKGALTPLERDTEVFERAGKLPSDHLPVRVRFQWPPAEMDGE